MMLLKEGLLACCPNHPRIFSRFSSSSGALKPLLPCSSFTCATTRFTATCCTSHARYVCKCKGSLQEMLSAVDSKDGSYLACILLCSHWQATSPSRLPATALLVVNGLMFAKPFEALAETCEANNSVFSMNMPLLLFVALIGATVGGLLARQRRGELRRLNEQLRQINAALRRQAKIESYAPSLSYVPVSGRIPENEIIVDERKQDLISRLKNGKNFLRNQDLENAFFEFKSALELAQKLEDPIEEKKAARGLGASLQRQGKFRDAIKYHLMVLEISQREGEESGNTEAYGAIADCYTELGDLERAAKYYDQYIARLQSD
ncbi:protein FLUORESCENT IN BLUE LIGHT, chloroplastic-like isoform X1 [Primulina eburnea]|uniref:protein FLUORESCENT IN BLUE LIGHT, chloroplastic-like isoform X1 n=1 Tax=Primulina eburnea TaxID=1245227 RepID=UPI003C6CAB7B